MTRVVNAAGILILTIVPAVAQAVGFGVRVGPQYRTEITPLQNGNYLVKAKGSSAAVNYWCGIGDYAIRTLGVPYSQRIYIAKAYVPNVRTVEFSLKPPPGADTDRGYSITVNRVGENMSASSAQNYCYDNFMDFDF